MLYDNIRIKILSMKIFFQILFVWEENDLVFSSELEKIALKQQHKNSPLPPPPPPHTHTLKFSMLRVQGSQGKGTHIFYETIKLV